MPWDIKQAVRKDSKFLAALEDFSPAMEDAADIVFQAIEENFAGESAASEPWEGLAESTLRDRRRLGYGDGPILTRTGSLRSAATNHKVITSDSSEVGLESGHPYGKFHVSLEPRTKIPFRDFLAVSNEHKDRITKAIIKHLER